MQPSIKKYNPSSEYYFDENCYITEILNSEEDPILSIAKVRVKPGVSTKLHRLSATIERYVILEGQGLIEVGDLSPKKVTPFDVVIIPPQCPQKITNTGVNPLLFLAICSPRFKSEIYVQLEV